MNPLSSWRPRTALLWLLLCAPLVAGQTTCGGVSCSRLCSALTVNTTTTTTTTTTTLSPTVSSIAVQCEDTIFTRCSCDCVHEQLVQNCRENTSILPAVVVLVSVLFAAVLFRLVLWRYVREPCHAFAAKCDFVLCSQYSCCGHLADSIRGRWARLRGRAPTGPILISARDTAAVAAAGVGAAMKGGMSMSEAQRRKEKEAEVVAALNGGYCAVPIVPPTIPFAPITPATTTTTRAFPPFPSFPPTTHTVALLPPPPLMPPTVTTQPIAPSSPPIISPDSLLAGPPAYGEDTGITFEQAYYMARQSSPIPTRGVPVTPTTTPTTTQTTPTPTRRSLPLDRPPAHASRSRASLTRTWHEPTLMAGPQDD